MRLVFVIVACVVVLPVVAEAQTTASPEATLLAYSSLSSTVTLPTTSVGVGVYLSVQGGHKGGAGDAAVAEAADAFVRQNNLQLLQDLSLGTGPALADLATAACIDTASFARFAALVRADRAALVALADLSKLTPERAVAFLARIGKIVTGDAVLAPAYERFVARQQQG